MVRGEKSLRTHGWYQPGTSAELPPQGEHL
jgi:hypothetical protein